MSQETKVAIGLVIVYGIFLLIGWAMGGFSKEELQGGDEDDD